MKPIHFFSKKQEKKPSEIEFIRETMQSLSNQVKVLQLSLQELTLGNDPMLRRIKQLEEDFLFTHTRDQEFHETYTTTLSHLSLSITQIDSELQNLSEQYVQLKKYIRILEKRMEFDNRFCKEQMDSFQERLIKLEEKYEEPKKEQTQLFQTAKQVLESKKKDSNVK